MLDFMDRYHKVDNIVDTRVLLDHNCFVQTIQDWQLKEERISKVWCGVYV